MKKIQDVIRQIETTLKIAKSNRILRIVSLVIWFLFLIFLFILAFTAFAIMDWKNIHSSFWFIVTITIILLLTVIIIWIIGFIYSLILLSAISKIDQDYSLGIGSTGGILMIVGIFISFLRIFSAFIVCKELDESLYKAQNDQKNFGNQEV